MRPVRRRNAKRTHIVARSIYIASPSAGTGKSTVALGLEAMGRRAGELLLDAVAGRPRAGTTTMPTRLVVRDSTVGR